MGHIGAVQGWFAAGLQDLLDGVLAPLRNVHKFDPVVRLPAGPRARLARGRTGRPRPGRRRPRVRDRINYRIVAGIVAFAVLAAATPRRSPDASPRRRLRGGPGLLDRGGGLARRRPGRRRGAARSPAPCSAATCGASPRDEPFQALASTPWAVRNAVPLTPAGNIRMLDAVEEQLAQGRGLARPGRLPAAQRGRATSWCATTSTRGDDNPDPVLVHQALDESDRDRAGGDVRSGRRRWGPPRRRARPGRSSTAAGRTTTPPSRSTRSTAAAVGRDRHGPAPVVVGGPEDLLDLTALGVIDDVVPTRLAADLGDEEVGDAPLVLTDGYRSVVRHFGRIHDATSPVRTREQAEAPQEPSRTTGCRTRTGGRPSPSTTGSTVCARPARSRTPVPGRRRADGMPYAAIDGHPSTSWQSSRFTDDEHWWEVDLEDDVVPGSVVVTGALVGEQEVEVSTDDWTSEAVVLPPTPRPASRWATPTRTSSGSPTSPDVRAPRSASPRSRWRVSPRPDALALPEVPEGAGAPDAIVLRAIGDDRTGCAVVDLDVRCVQGREVSAEEPLGMARRITLPQAAAYDASLRVRGVPGRALETLVRQDSLRGRPGLVERRRRPAGLGPGGGGRQRRHHLVGRPLRRATERGPAVAAAADDRLRSRSASTRTPRRGHPSRWSCAGRAGAAASSSTRTARRRFAAHQDRRAHPRRGRGGAGHRPWTSAAPRQRSRSASPSCAWAAPGDCRRRSPTSRSSCRAAPGPTW